jgi:uncharacterized protein
LKIQPDSIAGTNAVTRLGQGEVWIGGARHTGSLLVPWVGEVRLWRPSDAEAVIAADFAAVLELDPEVVIFGSGATQRFVSPALTHVLLERRIGVETMDTAAACRTFNVLVSEGRRVVAALLGIASREP